MHYSFHITDDVYKPELKLHSEVFFESTYQRENQRLQWLGFQVMATFGFQQTFLSDFLFSQIYDTLESKTKSKISSQASSLVKLVKFALTSIKQLKL